ncbi:MAG: beta-ketoacyl-ACP synthase 3 [Solirubrobacteraceae bacterium]
MPRGLVHRNCLSELFLTDSARVDDTHFVAAAQLPVAHPYYGDHVGPAAGVDPLLLLECCRQAETHAVHAHFAAPADTKFVLRSWRMRLSDLPAPFAAAGPHELTIAATTSDATWRGTVLRSQRYAMQVFLAGTAVADVAMHADYLSGELYDGVRSRGRQTAPPSSDDFRAADPCGGVAPWRVGRNHADNVVLQALRVDGDAIHCRLRVLGGHASMFDHAQDHLPGMVLMEAARQMCVMAAERLAGIAPREALVTALQASFSAYAELDAPVCVIARCESAGGDPAARTIAVAFVQDDETIAEASVDLRSSAPALAEDAPTGRLRSRTWSRRTNRAAVVTGLGSWTPPDAVTNHRLAEELDTSDEWIRSRTGIGQRYVVAPGTSTSDMAIEAGMRALESSPDGHTVNAVVLATSTPDRSCPATAPLVASRLGLLGAAAFDVGAVCTGFVYALTTAAGLISAHAADTVLVIGADAFSTILDPDDRCTRVIFGDGAGAVVLRAGDPDEPGALLGFDLGSDGDAAEMITVPAGGSQERSSDVEAEDGQHYFQMDGQPVFARAVRRMTESTRVIAEAADWRLEQIDHLVAHQANVRILNACARELGLPTDRVVCNLDRVGNTVAASIPLALADAADSGELVAGERIVLTAFGGGLTWGSTALIWPDIDVRNRPTATAATGRAHD